MEATTTTEIAFSKLALGTVALGIDYGISNRQGKPSQQQSFDILEAAATAGIKTLDTARSYGNAENLIGDFFAGRQNLPTVCSKFKITKEALRNKDLALREIENSIECSLRNLQLQQLPVCLLHMDRTLPLHQVLAIVPTILEEFKKEGLIAMAGVSVDHPQEVEAFLRHPVLECYQVPLNVFDQRLLKGQMLQRLKEESKIVCVRSVFLQGLFFLDEAHLQGNLAPAAASLQALRKLADKAGMSLQQLAFSFVRDLDGVSSVLFGAEKVEQVEQNIALLKGESIPAEIREEMYVMFQGISETIITPGLWSR